MVARRLRAGRCHGRVVASAIALIALFLCALFASAGSAMAAVTEYRVGVLTMLDHGSTISKWKPLADYLTSKIPDSSFKVVPLDNGATEFFLSHADVDFILTNPSTFLMLKDEYALRPMFTLKHEHLGSVTDQYGAVIIARATRDDIKSLTDLRGKSLMAFGPQSFAGWWMAWRELKAVGLNPYSELSSLEFSGNQVEAVAYAVRDGQVDAGTLRTGVLEDMAEAGLIKLEDFKVVGEVKKPGFPYLLSSRLYPEWVLASSRHVSDSVVGAVREALAGLAPGAPTLEAAGIAGFSTSMDFRPVSECMDALNMWPQNNISPSTVWRRYRSMMVTVAATMAVLVGLVVYAFVLNARLRSSRRELQAQHQQLLELSHGLEKRIHKEVTSSREKDLMLINQHHLVNLGRLSAGITHEINTPLTYMKGNVEMLRAQLNRTLSEQAASEAFERYLGPITDGIDRIMTIIGSMKEIVGVVKPYKEIAEINVYTTVIYAARLINTQAKHISPVYINGVLFSIDMGRDAEKFMATLNSANIEQVWIALLNNALEAFEDTTLPFEARRVEVVMAARPEGGVLVTIRDNAGPIPEATMGSLFDLFVTTKPEGSGIGLHVARMLIEGMGGAISARNDGEWAVFEIAL